MLYYQRIINTMWGWPLPDVLSQIVYKCIHTSYTSSLNKDYFNTVEPGKPISGLDDTISIASCLLMDRVYSVSSDGKSHYWIANRRNSSTDKIRSYRRNNVGKMERIKRFGILPKNY